MNETGKRALLYGGAMVVLGGITAAWGSTRADADVLTLLSSADVQLRMAYVLPADGRAPARDELIATASSHLEVVERQQPGMAVTAEFRGFAHMLRGEFGEAAASYRAARSCSDCQEEQRDVLVFNEARMLAKGGQLTQALEVFARHGAALDLRFGHQRGVEEAQILRRLERREEAEAKLAAIVADAAAPSFLVLQAADELVTLGADAMGESALRRIAGEQPMADYHLARLKLRRGEVDTSLELLERAFATRPAEVRQRLRSEGEAWSVVAGTTRFQRLEEPTRAAPGR